jgi:hypothetical protein
MGGEQNSTISQSFAKQARRGRSDRTVDINHQRIHIDDMAESTQCTTMQNQTEDPRIHRRSKLVPVADQSEFQRCCSIFSAHDHGVSPTMAMARNAPGEEPTELLGNRFGEHSTQLGMAIPWQVGFENW